MSGIEAGRLNKRVTIEAETSVSNGQGGYTTEWAPIATRPTVWAEVIALTGDEALAVGVERAVQQYRVTIRQRDDLSTKHRLNYGGRFLDIRSAMPDPRADDALLLICEGVGIEQA